MPSPSASSFGSPAPLECINSWKARSASATRSSVGVLEQLGHHARTRLRDGATLTFVSNVQVTSVVEANPYGDFIAARRINLEAFPRRVVEQARTTRVLVVVKDDVLI